jgi:multimeric flavodoxin WrbA
MTEARKIMKVIALNGSARKNGNTAILLNLVLDELKTEGIETELIQMAGTALPGCKACYKCFKNKNKHCSVETDMLNDIIDKMLAAEGILLGSPTYFSDATANMRAFIERCGFVARANDYMFKGKVGAAVVAVRRAGAIQAFSGMNLFLHYMQMMMPGTSYWSIGLGREIGDVLKDDEGIQTMKDLGKNMAWLMKKVYA